MLTQDLDEALRVACGQDPSFVCEVVLDWTGSRRWAQLADVVFARSLTILVIVGLAVVVQHLVDRAVNRFVGTMSGELQPGRRLKRRLRRTRLGQRLPEGVLSTGVYSLRSAARAATLGVVLKSIAAVLIWVLAAITVLGELGINLGPLVASAGIAGVAVGFGAQSLVKDFLAGIFILVEDQYGVGDIVDVGELGGTVVSGTVEAVSLRTTRLRSVNGTVWHVPNGTVLRVGNMSQQWARALLDVSVAYGADVDQAQAIIKAVADGLWQDPDWQRSVLEEPEVWGIEELAADGVTIRLVVKTQPSEQFRVMRELRSRLKRALDAQGVEIPYPQRTVWVRRDAGSSAEAEAGEGLALDEIADEPTAGRAAPAAKAAKRARKRPLGG